MSVKIMSAAWDVAGLTSTQKIVLLSLADQANDDGLCWPSAASTSRRTSLCERATRRAIADLEKAGHISRRIQSGKATFYFVHPCTKCTPELNAPLHVVPEPLHVVPMTPAPGVNITVRNRKEPSVTLPDCKPENLTDQIVADACGQNDHIDKDKMTGCHVVKMTNSSVYENTETTTEIHTSPGGDLPTIKPRAGINHKAIVDMYNRLLPELPRCKLLTDKRKAAINGCCSVKDTFRSLDFWEAYFSAVRKSDFLMGRSKDWKADFDFLTTKSKFVKVYEGGYK